MSIQFDGQKNNPQLDQDNALFFELFNLDELQKIQDVFSEANGVSSIITDTNGNPITESSNFSNLCKDIIRKTKEGNTHCLKTEQLLSLHHNNGPLINQCGNCGLWEAGVNIIVGQKHIGNWIIGQVRHEIIDESQVHKYAEKIGVNREAFSLALNETPIMSIARFNSIAKMLHVFVNEIASKAHKNKQLIENKNNHQAIIQTAMDGFWLVDLKGNLLEVNRSYCKMSGFSEEELLNMCITDLEVLENKEETLAHINTIIHYGEDKFETKHRKKDGSTLDVEINVQYQNFNGGQIVVFIKDISIRKENQTNLLKRNRLIESIMNISPDMLYIYDIEEQKNIFSNEGVNKLLGYTIEDLKLMGNDILPKLMHPNDWKRYIKKILPRYTKLSENEEFVHQYRLKDKDGNWHWIESTEIIYLRNKDNSPKQIFGTGRDITSKYTIQAQLLEAEWKFKALFEQGPIGVAYHEMIYDENGNSIDYRFIDANKSYIELTGVDPRGKTVLEAFPGIEKDTFDWIGQFGSVAKSGKTIRFESYLEANKRWYDVVGYQYKPDCFVAAFTEITQRKVAEQALIESEILLQQKEQRLSQALNATTDAIWEWNYVTGKTHYNSRWFEMLGYQDQEFEMTFETFQKLCHPEDFDQTVAKIGDVLETQKSQGYMAEFRMKHKNGIWKWIMGRGNVVKRDENQNPIMLSGTNTDISDRKKVEEELRLSEEKFRNLVWDMQIGVLLQGPKSEIILCNPKALELLGLTEDQLLGKTSFDVDWNIIYEDGTSFPGELHPVPQAISTLKPINNVVMGIYHPFQKERIWLLVDAVPELNNDGTLRQVVCTFNNITERKKTEEKLVQNEQYLKETQQIAQLGTYTLDVTTGIWTSTEILDSIFGIPSDFNKSIAGWVSIIHPEWQQIMTDYFANEVVGKKIPFDKEYKIIRRNDNQERWMHGIGRLKYNEDGQPIMMLGTISDITEKKLAEVKIQESETRLARAERVAKIGNWKLDLNTKHMLSSEGARIIYGVDKDDILLEDIQKVPLVEYRPILDKALIDLIKNDIPYDIEFKIRKQKDGKILDIHSIAEYDKKRNIVFGVVYDITERKKAEETIRNTKILLEKTIEQSPVPMVLVSMPDARIQIANKACLDFLGVQDESTYINKTLLEINPSWKDFDKNGNQNTLEQIPLVRSIYGEIVENEERSVVRKDGTIRHQLVSSYPIYDDKGAIIAGYVIIMDITERKLIELKLKEKNEDFETQNEEYLQLNEELTQTNEELYYSKERAEESDRLKSAFLANMSHEIRTPMNGILGFTELLKESQLSGETRNSYINIIEKSGARMLNIINDIISISKVESGQMEVFISETNINEQLDFLYSFFKLEIEQKGLQFIVNKGLHEKEIIVHSDKEKIYAVLTNLVKNAIKFTNEGTIEFGYKICENYYEFYVSDTGVGIPKEQKDIVFERFRQGSELLTRNYEGAGLGLSISKAYVEMLGGKIWVESHMGKGSIFYFTIPFSESIDGNSNIYVDQFDEKQINFSRKLNILIAEDDYSSEMLLSLALEEISGKIIVARNGFDAVSLCRNNSDIDLIFMDNKMPIMDGYEATCKIREFNKEVIIIAQTAFALPGDREKVVEAGCNDYIAKPFNQKLLFETIRKYFK